MSLSYTTKSISLQGVLWLLLLSVLGSSNLEAASAAQTDEENSLVQRVINIRFSDHFKRVGLISEERDLTSLDQVNLFFTADACLDILLLFSIYPFIKNLLEQRCFLYNILTILWLLGQNAREDTDAQALNLQRSLHAKLTCKQFILTLRLKVVNYLYSSGERSPLLLFTTLITPNLLMLFWEVEHRRKESKASLPILLNIVGLAMVYGLCMLYFKHTRNPSSRVLTISNQYDLWIRGAALCLLIILSNEALMQWSLHPLFSFCYEQLLQSVSLVLVGFSLSSAKTIFTSELTENKFPLLLQLLLFYQREIKTSLVWLFNSTNTNQ